MQSGNIFSKEDNGWKNGSFANEDDKGKKRKLCLYLNSQAQCHEIYWGVEV
jgi:hypothetical protein